MTAAPRIRTGWDALPQAFAKLDPRHVFRSPVIFVVWVGSVLTTVLAVKDPSVFAISVTVWLWATVLFANLAEAVAEGRGKAQAETLRTTRTETTARRLRRTRPAPEEQVRRHRPADRRPRRRRGRPGHPRRRRRRRGRRHGRRVGDHRRVRARHPRVRRRPVRRHRRHDRAVGPDRRQGHQQARRDLHRPDDRPGRGRRAPEDPQRDRPDDPAHHADPDLPAGRHGASSRWRSTPVGLQPVVVLVALLVCLIPTTIGALLSAIGIAGMDRLVQHNVLAMSGRAVEAAGDVSHPAARQDRHDHLRQPPGQRASSPSGAPTRADLLRAAYLSSLADETPEGRSIVDHAPTARQSTRPPARSPQLRQAGAEFVPFSASTRMSGVDLPDGTTVSARAPAPAVAAVGRGPCGGHVAGDLHYAVDGISADGGTPLVVARRRTARPPAPWAWSTSRTSSSPACANASTSCARWASAP